VVWHYVTSVKEILRGCKNFVIFDFHYFSVPLLLKTFFSHWRKLKEEYPRGFEFKSYSMIFLGNAASRALGAFIRTIFILLGLISEVLILSAGIFILLFWLLLPVILVVGFWVGIDLLV